jgi:hypothetical protein
MLHCPSSIEPSAKRPVRVSRVSRYITTQSAATPSMGAVELP